VAECGECSGKSVRMDKGSFFTEGKIPSLNGWRAVAIALVILDHAKFTVGFPINRLTNAGWTFFSQGNLGVRIFFVLSGFLITHLLLLEAEKTGAISLKNFFLRRCLRILPVYAAYLGVLAGLVFLKVYSGEIASSWIGALTFTRNMVGPVSSYTGHFWSLAVEEQFYLLWPFCLSTLLWRRPGAAMKLFLVPLCLCPALRFAEFNVEANGEFYGRILGGNSILIYADSLAIGCLGAFLVRRIVLRPSPAMGSVIIVTAVAIIILGAFWDNIIGNSGRMATALIPTVQAAAILIAMWVSTLNEETLVYRFLNWAPVNALGVLSYSLYIWHVLFLSSYTGHSLLRLLFDWRTWWLAALATAALSYFCVERPILKWKKKFSASAGDYVVHDVRATRANTPAATGTNP
jgi:peptidoglycan/LPS O-acetylase OafA/YrhL